MNKMIKYHNGNLIEYAILPLVDYHDDILKQPTIPVNFATRKSSEIEFIGYSLVESMIHYGGMGLSANQIGFKDRMCVINMHTESWIMINPKIIDKSGTFADFSEGCLSYPGLYLKLKRPDYIKVKFQALGGQELEQEFNGLTAVCIQHEIDHLDGIRYTDGLSPIKLEQAKKKIKKNLRRIKNMTAEEVQEIVKSRTTVSY